ncbi:MAG: Rpn family recombination-promoting nuclease/putative transposase [Burkholderiaceae bacterium]
MAARIPHDTTYKALFRFPVMVRDLLLGFVPEPWVERIDFASLRPASGPATTDDLRERSSDLIWKVRLRAAEPDAMPAPVHGDRKTGQRREWLYIYLLMEFQSGNDPSMAVRVMAYVALLYQDLIRAKAVRRGGSLPLVFPIVLYNGRPSWSAARDVADMIRPAAADLEPWRPRLRYFLFDEHREAARARRAGRPLPDNLAGLLVGIETDSRLSALDAHGKRLFRQMPAELHDSLGQVVVAWLNRVVAARWGSDDNAPRIEHFREVGMLAQKVEGWGARYRREGMIKGIAEGKAKGIAEGKAKGMAEGKAQGKIELLERQLARRFGAPLPDWVRPRLAAADIARLDDLAERIFDATSLEALLDQPPESLQEPRPRRRQRS